MFKHHDVACDLSAPALMSMGAGADGALRGKCAAWESTLGLSRSPFRRRGVGGSRRSRWFTAMWGFPTPKALPDTDSSTCRQTRHDNDDSTAHMTLYGRSNTRYKPRSVNHS